MDIEWLAHRLQHTATGTATANRDYQGHQPARFFGSAGEFVFWDAPSPPPLCTCCLRAVTSASSSCTRTRASSRNLSWARCCCHVRRPCEKKQDKVRASYRTCVGPREREGAKRGRTHDVDGRTEERDGDHARGVICVELGMARARWLGACARA